MKRVWGVNIGIKGYYHSPHLALSEHGVANNTEAAFPDNLIENEHISGGYNYFGAFQR
jgi:hypothetical protein